MSRDRAIVVYRAVNRVNGKRYIGVTSDIRQRTKEHCADARSRPITRLHLAIKKYGASTFEFSVVSEWETRQEALDEEIRLIAIEKPEYNVTKGGLGTLGLRIRAVIRLSDGARYESVRAAACDNTLSQMRIVQICQGGGATKAGERFMYADQSAPPKSIRKTPEQLLEVRKRVLIGAAKGRKTQSMPVICVDDGRRFSSISEAARHYGKHLSAVADAIQRNGRAGGLKFELCEAA